MLEVHLQFLPLRPPVFSVIEPADVIGKGLLTWVLCQLIGNESPKCQATLA